MFFMTYQDKFIEKAMSSFVMTGLISFMALSTSLIAESLYSIQPCILCSYQRYIYAAIGISSVFAIVALNKKSMTYFILFLAFAGTCVSAYHGLIQYGLIEDTCSIFQVSSLENFKTKLLSNQPPSCSEAMFAFLGLPISLWSFAGYFLCILLITKLVRLNVFKPFVSKNL
jgi:disulfide bond formation protein DsbB